MAEVHVSLVKYDDFAGLDAGAHLPGALGVGVLGGVHDGKARQKTLQIQPQMTFGGRLAPSMLGPVHARGDQRNGGRIHQVDRPLEPADKSLAGFAADKARGQITQMLEDRPEQFLGHLRRPYFVGMREVVAAGRSGPSETGQRPRMQLQRIADVIETDAVGQLRIAQGNHVTPRT